MRLYTVEFRVITPSDAMTPLMHIPNQKTKAWANSKPEASMNVTRELKINPSHFKEIDVYIAAGDVTAVKK